MSTLGMGRFELVRRVGEGSSGVVFEGRDLHTQSAVAIKLLHDSNEIADERFEREASVLAELQHPAIVRYVAHGRSEDDRRYLVMEWLTGHTLEEQLRGQRPVGEVLSLARRLSAGLSFAASRGVAHRDIKPENLFLVDGAVSAAKIVDFGLARRVSDRQKITQGLIVGTPLFMSPEQARGDPAIDPRTDMFSLGSVLYTCLCGRVPFSASEPMATLAKICFDEPIAIDRLAPHVPPRLRNLVELMLRKNRSDRPSWREVTGELADIAEDATSMQIAVSQIPAALTQTMELPLGEHRPRGNTSSLHRRGRGAEHRILAAVFVGELAQLPAAVDAAAHAATARFGARLERLLDGSRIVLTNQQLDASEQTVVAARCALALRDLLEARAPLVVCTGRAVVGDVQPLGELFERGAAMLTSTPAGVVRVDEASAALLEARFELSNQTPESCVLERERRGGEAPRTLLGRRTVFVGRERELQQLALIFQECLDEQVARVVLITAPAGGGKSRLRHELLERLRAVHPPFTLLTGRGDAVHAATQFGVIASAVHAWAEITASDSLERKREKLSARMAALVTPPRAAKLAPILGEMVGVPYPESNSPQLKAARSDHQLMADHMLATWLEWLEALSERGPLVVCLEDLHWSDPASLRFIEAALRSSRDRALLVLGFARPEVREAYPQLWAERDLTDIRLAKLGARACARMLDTLSGIDLPPALRTAIIERADGNPFFLEELVRSLHTSHGGDNLPETILAIVQARLDALGEEPKMLIRAASVFGQTFRLVGVRALFGVDATDFDFEGVLSSLCDREVIFRNGVASEHEYVFRHALIRDAAYMLLRDEDRALGHRLAAAWLEESGEAPALLADHYERGGVPSRASRHWAHAAEQAFEAGSLDDVLRCGERAIACGVEGEAFGELAAQLAEARSYDEDDAGAAAWAERARAKLTPGAAAWWRATQVATVACLRRGGPELDTLTAQMLAHYSADSTVPEQSLAIAYTVSECLRLMHDELGERMLALLPPQLPESLAGRPEGCLVSARGIKAFRAGNLSAALRFAQAALMIQRRAGALRDVCDTLGLCGYLLYEIGGYAEAESCFAEEAELGKRIGSTRDVAYGQLYLGAIYARGDRLDDAERMLGEALPGYMKLGAMSFHAEGLGHLAHVQCKLGRLVEAREVLARATQIGEIEVAPTAYLLARSASVALLAGLPSEALEHASRARDLVKEHSLSEFVAIIELSYVDSLLALGRRQEARAAAAASVTWLEAQAAKLDEPAHRASYLEAVHEHSRLRQLSEPTAP
ncbi:MAG: protein kinase [Polyangiales bacterium]